MHSFWSSVCTLTWRQSCHIGGMHGMPTGMPRCVRPASACLSAGSMTAARPPPSQQLRSQCLCASHASQAPDVPSHWRLPTSRGLAAAKMRAVLHSSLKMLGAVLHNVSAGLLVLPNALSFLL